MPRAEMRLLARERAPLAQRRIAGVLLAFRPEVAEPRREPAARAELSRAALAVAVEDETAEGHADDGAHG